MKALALLMTVATTLIMLGVAAGDESKEQPKPQPATHPTTLYSKRLSNGALLTFSRTVIVVTTHPVTSRPATSPTVTSEYVVYVVARPTTLPGVISEYSVIRHALQMVPSDKEEGKVIWTSDYHTTSDPIAFMLDWGRLTMSINVLDMAAIDGGRVVMVYQVGEGGPLKFALIDGSKDKPSTVAEGELPPPPGAEKWYSERIWRARITDLEPEVHVQGSLILGGKLHEWTISKEGKAERITTPVIRKD